MPVAFKNKLNKKIKILIAGKLWTIDSFSNSLLEQFVHQHHDFEPVVLSFMSFMVKWAVEAELWQNTKLIEDNTIYVIYL